MSVRKSAKFFPQSCIVFRTFLYGFSFIFHRRNFRFFEDSGFGIRDSGFEIRDSDWDFGGFSSLFEHFVIRIWDLNFEYINGMGGWGLGKTTLANKTLMF